jgi:type II secretory pathway component PulF
MIQMALRRLGMSANSLNEIVDVMLLRTKFGLQKRLDFYLNLAVYLRQGKPILQALRSLAQIYEDTGGRRGLRLRSKPYGDDARLLANPRDPKAKIIMTIVKNIEAGLTFPQAMSMWAPTLEVMLLSVGHAVGKLETSCEAVVRVSNEIADLRKAVLSAVRAPAGRLVIMVITITFLGDYLVPIFTHVGGNFGKHSPQLQTLIAMQNFVNHWLAFVILGLLIFVAIWLGVSLIGPRLSATEQINSRPTPCIAPMPVPSC